MNQPARVAPVGEAFRYVKENIGKQTLTLTTFIFLNQKFLKIYFLKAFVLQIVLISDEETFYSLYDIDGVPGHHASLRNCKNHPFGVLSI